MLGKMMYKLITPLGQWSPTVLGSRFNVRQDFHGPVRTASQFVFNIHYASGLLKTYVSY